MVKTLLFGIVASVFAFVLSTSTVLGQTPTTATGASGVMEATGPTGAQPNTTDTQSDTTTPGAPSTGFGF